MTRYRTIAFLAVLALAVFTSSTMVYANCGSCDSAAVQKTAGSDSAKACGADCAKACCASKKVSKTAKACGADCAKACCAGKAVKTAASGKACSVAKGAKTAAGCPKSAAATAFFTAFVKDNPEAAAHFFQTFAMQRPVEAATFFTAYAGKCEKSAKYVKSYAAETPELGTVIKVSDIKSTALKTSGDSAKKACCPLSGKKTKGVKKSTSTKKTASVQ